MNDMLLNMILLPLVAFGHLIAAQDYGLSSSPIVINEVLPKSTNASDWIELYNAGQVDVDLSHWVLSDSDDSHIFSLPVGTVLPSAAYLVIEQYPNGVFGFDFGLAVSGDTVRLFDANDTLVDSTAWQDGDILENESWGRRPNGFGPFVTLCVPTAGTENWDPSKELFDPNRVVEVIIEMVPEDWDFIRTQSRSIETLFGSGCMEQPFGSPFIYKPATVTVDGEMFVNVGVRKKGFLGSLDERKPSLKIKFDKYVDG